MVPGILGKKVGMTQVFNEDGARISVTVLEAGPCYVQAVKTIESDGYNAVQLGYGEKKESRSKKPQREYLKANKLTPKRFVKELRCDEAPDVKVGAKVTNRMLQAGDFVDITGVSKGKGTQGVVKRHGFSGSLASHGAGNMERRPGSIGQSSYPSRVFKGMRMPGHMGSDKVTVQNVEVIAVDPENNTVAVKGSVPGASGTYFVMRYALKKPLAERQYQEEEEVLEPEEKLEEGSAGQQSPPKPEAGEGESVNGADGSDVKVEEAPAEGQIEASAEQKEDKKEIKE